MGTGTNSGAVQAALGQQEFTRLVRYAYDRGIRFFETAEAYETPAMLGEALKGIPRENYHLMSKVTTFHEGIDPQSQVRRVASHLADRVLRHHAAALAAHARLAGDDQALAGRDPRGAAAEDHPLARRLGARAARAAADARHQLARSGD